MLSLEQHLSLVVACVWTDWVPDVRQIAGCIHLCNLVQHLGCSFDTVPAINGVVTGHTHRNKIRILIGLTEILHGLRRRFIGIGFGVARQISAKIGSRSLNLISPGLFGPSNAGPG
jgi:hypothetical protein